MRLHLLTMGGETATDNVLPCGDLVGWHGIEGLLGHEPEVKHGLL